MPWKSGKAVVLPSCTTQALLPRSEEEAAVNHPAFESIYHCTTDQVFMLKLSKFSKIIATNNMFSVQSTHVFFSCYTEVLMTNSMFSLLALPPETPTMILVIPFLS